MVSRVFRTVLRNPTAAKDIGFPRETVFDYQSAARQLERIADHSTKIARIALQVEGSSDVEGEALIGLQEAAVGVPELAMDALLEDDSEKATEMANDARAMIQEIDAHAREVDNEIRGLDDPQRAQRLGLVVDSLSRTADYGSNIAESALQKAAPRPN
jgi:phosphate uptake regulator